MGSSLLRAEERMKQVKSMLLASGDLIFLEKQALGGPADEPEFKDVA